MKICGVGPSKKTSSRKCCTHARLKWRRETTNRWNIAESRELHLRDWSKMEDGLLSLKWNNHKSTFFHILSEVRGKHTYTDATLACEGKFYPVHKLVMSTCSDYFAEIFEKTPCKNPVVVLKDIKKSDLDALLDYMYIGEVDVRQSELAGLIKAAECLRIKGLAVPDEDPTKSQKKGPNNVPEKREDSPPAKRKRRDSGERARSLHSPVPRGSSLSSSSSSSHLPSTSSSVPSHAPSQQSSVPESLVPSQSMLPPSGLHQESRHSDSLRGRQEQQSSSQGSALRPSPDPLSQRSAETVQSSSSSQRTSEASMLPVQMIKVEVDEGTDSGSKEVLADRGEEGAGDIGDEDETSNNDFTDYQSHSGEIEKEEHDQMDSYGADQLPGPSGLQGGPPMLGWGDEGEGGFPHNLFSSDDPASQQACVGGTGMAMVVVAAAALDSGTSRHTTCNPPLPARHLWTASSSPSSSSAAISREAVVVGPGLSGGAPGGGALGWTLGHGRNTVSVDKHYPCHLCHYTCRSRVDLDKHIRTHTGEKPFRCHLCTYMSGDKSNLRRHMVGVHKLKPTDVALRSPVQSLANITFPTKRPPIPPLVLPPLPAIASSNEPPTPPKHSMKGPFILKGPAGADEKTSPRPSSSAQDDDIDVHSVPSLKSPCGLTPVLRTGAPSSTPRLLQPHPQPGAGGQSLTSPHSPRQ